MAAGEILSLLARVNLAAAATIVLVVALRKIARPWFGARLVYSLWLLPMLAAGAMLAPARAASVAAETARSTASARVDVSPLFEGAKPLAAPSVAVTPMLDPRMVIVTLWLIGVAACALIMILLQRRFIAEVRKGAVGPAVVGVLTPRIVTPADFEQKFNSEEQALVLAHERAHIARQDSRLNGLSAALQCLFWFNPLIHLAAHLMRIDQEMACDEAVVTRFPDARRVYAQALVKAQLAIRPLPLGCYWPPGAEHPLLERIAMLKQKDLSCRRRVAGGSALAVLCAVTGFAAWASQPPQPRIASPPIAQIAYERDAQLIFVPVHLAGSRTLWFVVDTGAQHTVIDAATAKDLKLSVISSDQVAGAGQGTVGRQHAAPTDVSLGSVRLHVADPWIIDLNHPPLGRHEDGLIGADFFAAYVVRIDPERQTISLYDPKTFKYRGRGAAVPLDFPENRMFVDLRLSVNTDPPVVHRVRVDTGSSDAVSDDLVRQSSERRKSWQGVGLGQPYIDYSGILDRVEIGPYVVRRSWGASNSKPAMGMEILRRFITTFDATRGVLYLEPNSHLGDPVPEPVVASAP